jgi:hypothetical protein
VANRNRGRGGRSRKRRPAAGRAPTANGVSKAASPESEEGGGGKEKSSEERPPKSEGVRSRGGATRRSGAGNRDPLGERPQAPWHPLPLSELLVLIGAIGLVIGLKRGASSGGPLLGAGIAAVLIGTVEVTLREHLSGYRSHALLLTLVVIAILDTPVLLLVAPLTPTVKVALFLLDAALGTPLFKLLRARYVDALRERRFAGRN